jgi:hypothetical protein
MVKKLFIHIESTLPFVPQTLDVKTIADAILFDISEGETSACDEEGEEVCVTFKITNHASK